MPFPTNRRRIRCVIEALRERAEERNTMCALFYTIEGELDALFVAREIHRSARPPPHHTRKIIRWACRKNNLDHEVKYTQDRLDRSVSAVVAHDQSKKGRQLRWMLCELLKQRRRMRRNARVVQLELPFKGEA